MISSSVHNVSPYLADSSNQFRQQLESKNPAEEKPVHPIEKPAHPIEKPETLPVIDKGLMPDDLEAKQIEENIQARRDHARQAAVHAEELRQTQRNIDAYVNATSDSDDTHNTKNAADINPANVYVKSLEYQKRDDLLAAFEQATTPEGLGMKINIML
jgi:hypothetical protein